MNRIPSHIASLHRLLEVGMRTQMIAEPLFARDAAMPCAELAAMLEERGFDECGVERKGCVKEFVCREQLNGGTAGDRAQLIPLDRAVAPEAPLWTSMQRVASHGSLYVLGDCGVNQIVTKADLNKQPARLLMFGVVSMLEMILLELLRVHHGGESWKKHLSPGRIKKAEELQGMRQQRGDEIDLADCLQLCDKVTICLKTKSILDTWQNEQGGSRTDIERFFKEVQRVRDNLAHAQSPADESGWPTVFRHLQQTERMVHASVEVLGTVKASDS